MADSEIYNLPVQSTRVLTDIIPIDHDPSGSVETRQLSILNLFREVATELTISAGAVTFTQLHHKLQPQTGTSDDLDTINGTTAGQTGVIYASDFGTDTITIKHNTGNILCVGGTDIALSYGCVFWFSDGTKIFISGGGGSGSGGGDVTPYRFSVSVSANDLIVALKDKDGNDPSSGSPVKIQIGNTVRTVSSALSITLADGTNWFNLGSAELATLEQDLFISAIWDSNSSAVALGLSRVPWDGNVSDYSATTTAENHLYGHSGYTSTDPVQVIGRCAATLSAGAGYTWTVPTFDDDNLKHRPTYVTRWLSWTPTRTGYSANPTNTVYQYMIDRETIFILGRDGADGTSNANTNQLSLPFAAVSTTNIVYQFIAASTNGGAAVATPSYGAILTPNWSTLVFGLDMTFNSTGWTTSLGKRLRTVTGFYKIK